MNLAYGQRSSKTVGDPDNGGFRNYYIRDAQGNIMATYLYKSVGGNYATMLLGEQPIYGSKRVGSYAESREMIATHPTGANYTHPMQPAHTRYELTDHLGNVAAVVSGRLLPMIGPGQQFQAELLSAQGYEAFGSLLPGRNYSSANYRFGFQGQEKDDEVYGATGTSYAFEYRMHDPRVGRFWSIDPLAAKYPHNSPYAFSENRVVDAVELEGKESLWYQLDDRIQLQTPLIAITTSEAVAVGVDVQGNVGIMYTPSLGVGEGGGIAVSSSLVISSANMNEIGGPGFTVGMMAAGGGGISGEGNVAWPSSSSDHENLGITVGSSYGVFSGGYIEAQYSFVAYSKIKDIPESVFSTIETLSGWTKDQTLGQIHSMQGQLSTLMTQTNQHNNQYTPYPVKALRSQLDIGNLFENVVKSILPDQLNKAEEPPAKGD